MEANALLRTTHPPISMGAVALITEKTNRSFAFYFFLNLSAFNFNIKAQLINCRTIQKGRHSKIGNSQPPLTPVVLCLLTPLLYVNYYKVTMKEKGKIFFV